MLLTKLDISQAGKIFYPLTLKKMKKAKLPTVKKGETGKQYAHRLLNIATEKAKIQSAIDNKALLDRIARPDSLLRQMMDCYLQISKY